jgi:molybdopterin converting factor small subunit
MKIKIKVFAAMKDFFDSEFEIEVPPQVSVSDLFNILMVKQPFVLPILTKSRVAIDENFVGSDYTLNENDHVYILPPSSGG